MNRRKFITTSAIGAGALTMLPTSTIASNNVNSLSSLNKITNISLSSLPFNFTKAHEGLIAELNQLGYIYDSNKLVKLSSKCYAISVQKKSLLGFTSDELALLVEENGSSKYYILEEKLAVEFNTLIENYSYNMDANGFSYDLAEFAFPVKIQEVKKGKESVFSYKNKLNNTITLKSNRKKSRAIIC
ncbi:hypothetical protein [Tenacibaculum halocynthiae]|uniref:hypothetical protein n=1 Tax=Tenacibaculum halocynthiae TaxID=1254437 RepID=UPI003D65BEF3